VSICLDLTREFNVGCLRTIISSGPAMALLRLAIASKDGGWILREDQEACDHVLAVLEAHGARYRFGAPLDLRWLRSGWSSHFEFDHGGIRVRTDFFTRPPRVTEEDLARLWREQEGRDPPFTGPRVLLEIKKTAREKDWPFVGELARMLSDPAEQMRCSRSADDLIELDRSHPGPAARLLPERPALAAIPRGRDELRLEIERERFAVMDTDARRMRSYVEATAGLESVWPQVQGRTAGLPLRQAHAIAVDFAERCLPTTPGGKPPATSS